MWLTNDHEYLPSISTTIDLSGRDLPLVRARVQVELCIGQVLGDRVTSEEDGARVELRKRRFELDHLRLVSQAPAVLGVLQVNTLSPGGAGDLHRLVSADSTSNPGRSTGRFGNTAECRWACNSPMSKAMSQPSDGQPTAQPLT